MNADSMPTIPPERGDDLHNLELAGKADLTLFMAGNQFMVMEELLAAFREENPDVERIFYETLPPGLELRQILAGGAVFQGRVIDVVPDVYTAVSEDAMKRLSEAGMIAGGGSPGAGADASADASTSADGGGEPMGGGRDDAGDGTGPASGASDPMGEVQGPAGEGLAPMGGGRDDAGSDSNPAGSGRDDAGESRKPGGIDGISIGGSGGTSDSGSAGPGGAGSDADAGYHVYLHNRIVLMVPEGNPVGIESVADLGRDDVRISQPNPENEDIAHHIINMYRRAGGDELVRRIMEEKRVAGTTLLTQVHHRETPERLAAGKADVGPVWATEVEHARGARGQGGSGGNVEQVGRAGAAMEMVDPGPELDQRESINYYICRLRGSAQPENGRRFMDFIFSERAREVYESHGFVV